MIKQYNTVCLTYVVQHLISSNSTYPQKKTMPFVWKPLPGTTGIESPPKDSVIVNHKKGWKLEELEKFCVLKAGLSAKSKEGVKRINELAKVSSFVYTLYDCHCYYLHVHISIYLVYFSY